MKSIILLIISSFLINYSFGQQTDSLKKETVICLCCGPIDPAKAPIYMVNEKLVTHDFISSLDPMQIESLNVLKGSEVNVYGAGAKNGAIVIKMKKSLKWVSLVDVFERKNINVADRNLPILFNGKPFKFDSLLIEHIKKLTCKIVDSSTIAPLANNYAGKYLAISETKD